MATKLRTNKTSRLASQIPAFRSVQLATLVDQVPKGANWIHEVKYDGYRCLLAIGGGEARAYTRSGLDWSEKFKHVVTAGAELNVKSALIDGEVVVLDEKGRSDFQTLQGVLKDGRANLTFFVFDLLELDGKDLTTQPLLVRKKLLEKIVGKRNKIIRYSEHSSKDGEAQFHKYCSLGLEGIVSKRVDAPYVGARAGNWLKTKCIQRQEFVIVGWQPSDKNRGFRSLLLAVNDGGKLRFAGKVGTGFDESEIARLLKRMKPLERKTPPIETSREAAKGTHWLEPKLVCEVAFSEMTSEGALRHPSYVGLREDKKPEAVVVETPATTSMAENRSKDLVTITNRDRVLFPETKTTKGELADYYHTVADIMLPWVTERPVSLVRCPQGRAKSCFFQKHDAGSFGDTVKHISIKEKSGKAEPYLFLEDERGLLTCVQMGTIEFHGWGARIEDIEKPDRLIFDLDPDEGLDFKKIKHAALDFRKALEKIGLQSFALVTGGKGVHVIVPLTPKAGWEDVRNFSSRFANAMAANEPNRFTANLSKAKRDGKIFIDYLRNQRGSTAVVPYSVRARAEAPVATPLTWEELEAIDKPSHWHVGDAQLLVKRAKSRALFGWGRVTQSLPKFK